MSTIPDGSVSTISTEAAAESAPRRRRKGSWTLRVGVICVGIVVITACVSLFWLPYPTTDMSGSRLEQPNFTHLLGTDELGHDLLTKLMVGSRISLIVGAGAVVLCGTLGVLVGLSAGFATSWLDAGLSTVLDILIAFPVLLLTMLIVAARGASLSTVIIGVGIALSAIVARVTRIAVKQVLSEQFITASRTSGTSWFSVILQHVLPNIWPILTVNLALMFGAAVLAEASLSYLGLGAPPPNESWGAMLQQAQQTVATAPVGAIAPGVALVILVLGVNLMADGLRDVGDPLRKRSR
jgi:peptide/nickel transport system permease protein